MEMYSQILFDNDMAIENGEICLTPGRCDDPEKAEMSLDLLVQAIARNGVEERAKEDLSWLIAATTGWMPTHLSAPACVKSHPLEEHLVLLSNELERLDGLNHEHVKQITVWYTFGGDNREVTFYNPNRDGSGNWLTDEIRKGIPM